MIGHCYTGAKCSQCDGLSHWPRPLSNINPLCIDVCTAVPSDPIPDNPEKEGRWNLWTRNIFQIFTLLPEIEGPPRRSQAVNSGAGFGLNSLVFAQICRCGRARRTYIYVRMYTVPNPGL